MALKYFLEYYDLVGVFHKAEIDDPEYVGEPIKVNGYVELAAGSVNSPIESIRGTGLKLFLDASVNLTFQDLYSENERTFKVTYTRENIVEFVGFLNPEGLFENYVSDKWIITLICADGLSFLKNLSYINNETKESFSGKQREIDIIANCLKRTNLDLNIYTSIGISYTGQPSNTNVLTQTYLNSERFLKEDNQDTIMNCEEVLRSVIEKYNAVVIFYQGGWHIFRPIELFNFTARTFYGYDSNAEPLNPVTKEVDFTFNLGSQIDGFYPHWAETDQQKRIKNSIGAYRINLKYGLVRNILANPTLLNQGTGFQSPSDFEVFDWNVLNSLYIGFNSDNPGVGVAVTNAPSVVLVLESDPITVTQNELFQFSFTQKSLNETPGIPPFLENNRIGYRVKLTDGVTDYYLLDDGSWTTSVEAIDIGTVFIGFTTFTVQADTLPVSGEITVQLQDARDVGFVYVTLIDIRSVTEIVGENHSFEKTVNPSSKILPTKEIFNGDIPSDSYLGTIYQFDETTPTETWVRDGFTNPNPILRVMGEDTMSMFQNPSIEFKGGLYGFIPYMSRVLINNNEGVYIPIEYRYNTKTNTMQLKLREIFGVFSGISYEFNFDYGNVVDPTIQG